MWRYRPSKKIVLGVKNRSGTKKSRRFDHLIGAEVPPIASPSVYSARFCLVCVSVTTAILVYTIRQIYSTVDKLHIV